MIKFKKCYFKHYQKQNVHRHDNSINNAIDAFVQAKIKQIIFSDNLSNTVYTFTVNYDGKMSSSGFKEQTRYIYMTI